MRQNYDSARSSSLSFSRALFLLPPLPRPHFAATQRQRHRCPITGALLMNFPTDNTGQQNLAVLKSFIAPVLLVQNFSRKRSHHRRTKERKIAGKGRKERGMLPIGYGLTSEYHEFRYFSLASKRSKPLNGIFKGILFLFRRVNEVASHRWGKAANERGRASFHLPLSLSVSVLVFSTRGGPGLRRMRRASGTAANFNI